MKKLVYRILIQTAFILLFFVFKSDSQNSYKYSVNLNKVTNDELKVELIAPKISKPEIIFYLPKIVPGTYNISDFGKFIHNVKAYDKLGKLLPVMQLDTNSWKIKKANQLYKLVYDVEDSWDSKLKHDVYSMAGTNFEEGENFSINTCGLFGYFDGMKKIPFELNFTRPENFYASTGLVPLRTGSDFDAFLCDNADRLYDSPIMFCIPDTTIIKVGNTDVLISVYSPRKMITSKFVAQTMVSLLQAAKDYLGGKLPVNKYAFIFYFNNGKTIKKESGAWEHSYSSFYVLNERSEDKAKDQIIDFASHEFFHIVTPLNICSKEVREFNFNKAVLSKHLWLYEGSTEYYAQHVQVTGRLITPDEFLSRLSEKIKISRKYLNDTLPFTELSKHSADLYVKQYYNVYLKGALICTCLDLYLLHLSNGTYGFKDLKHDLSIRYGPANYFNDDELFDEITKLTFPEIREFFSKYVEGTTPIPYEYFFDLAGVSYIRKKEINSLSDSANKTVSIKEHILEFDASPTPEQLKIRNIWLNTPCAK